MLKHRDRLAFVLVDLIIDTGVLRRGEWLHIFQDPHWVLYVADDDLHEALNMYPRARHARINNDTGLNEYTDT